MARHDFYEACQIIRRTNKPDGLGGAEWQEEPGEEIKAGIWNDNLVSSSTEAVVAGRTGNKAIFHVQTDLDVVLKQHDVILRKKDNRLYRITSNAIDKTTPDVAIEQYREVTAEVIE